MPLALASARQLRRAFAHLRHRAGRRGQRLGVDGLDRVDHDDRGLLGVERREDLLELDLGQHAHLRGVRGRAGARAARPARRSPRR